MRMKGFTRAGRRAAESVEFWPPLQLGSHMTETAFESALAARTADMLDACTRCGKCVEVCPVTGPAGVGDAAPKAVIAGVLDIVRTGEGPAAAKAWAKGCALTGDCIAACPEGVNPRFLLAMARVAMARQQDEPRERRKKGVENFRLVADGANVLVAHAARRRRSRAARPARRRAAAQRLDGQARRAPGFRVLHRLQRAQDAAHRAARARHHGRARRHLQRDGRSQPLLRHRPGAHRRHRSLRPRRHQFARQTGGRESRRHFLVRELSRAVHRDDAADDREGARRAAVRDDAVHAVPADALCRLAAAAQARGADEGRAAQASGHQGRGRSRHRAVAHGAGRGGRRTAISRRSA